MILYHMTNQTFEEILTTEFWTNMLKSLGIKKQKCTWDDNDKWKQKFILHSLGKFVKSDDINIMVS